MIYLYFGIACFVFLAIGFGLGMFVGMAIPPKKDLDEINEGITDGR